MAARERERTVLMANDVAGTLTRATNGDVSFTYDESYRHRRSATPLSVAMPLQQRTHTDAVITPWLWGLLPDNNMVLEAWGRQFHVSTSSPFTLLASPIGEDCPGAVRIIAEDRIDALISTGSEDIDWLTEAEVADKLRDLVHNSTAWLGARKTGRFSLAGAQPKTALLYRDGHWGDPHGSAATTHIIKPAVTGFDEHDLNEHLCLSAMRAAGIPAARTRVATFEDQSAIVVQRYDRRATPNGSFVRIHQEDMAQALGYHPADKYQNEGGPSAAEVAALLRRILPTDQALIDRELFLQALIWNWIIAGPDAHSKNYSILLRGPQVALAPFYDVSSALPYSDMPLQKIKLAMKFGSSYKMNPVNPPWAKLATDIGLRESRVVEIAKALLDRAVPAFEASADDDAVRTLDSKLPERMIELVAGRVVTCSKLLDA